ncbi:MAG: hypothetical protein QXU92_01370 [Candidatus Diapherotrites archaeon]
MQKKAQASLDYLLVFSGVVVVFVLATAVYLSTSDQQLNLSVFGFTEREKTFVDNVYIEQPRYDKKITEDNGDITIMVLPKKNLKNVTYYIKSSDGEEMLKYHSPRDEFENIAKSSSGNFYKANLWVSETLIVAKDKLKSNELYDFIMEVQYQNDVNEFFIQKKSIIGK